MVTALPSKPTDGQNPWYATMIAWMDGVALNVAELNADITNHAAGTNHIPAGGTVNQVLKKNSSTNYDASWQNESGGGTLTPPVVLTGTDINTTPLSISGASGQATNYFEVQDSAGTRLFQVQSDGEVRAGPAAPAINGTLKAGNTDPSRRGIVFRAALEQSASLMELLDSNGTALFKVAFDGVVTAPNVSAGVIVLDSNGTIPTGTPAGTVILRRP